VTHYEQTAARARRIAQHATGCTPQQAAEAVRAVGPDWFLAVEWLRQKMRVRK
jgi:hypothetical protein